MEKIISQDLFREIYSLVLSNAKYVLFHIYHVFLLQLLGYLSKVIFRLRGDNIIQVETSATYTNCGNMEENKLQDVTQTLIYSFSTNMGDTVKYQVKMLNTPSPTMQVSKISRGKVLFSSDTPIAWSILTVFGLKIQFAFQSYIV